MSEALADLAALSQNLSVTVASGDALDVRQFEAKEALSTLFEVSLRVVSKNDDIDFEAVVGQPARFELRANLPAPGATRFWDGIVSALELERVESTGLSTYHLTIVPTLWLATQRRNHRIFQQLSEPQIVRKLLAEWEIEPVVRLSGQYKERKYRVQYGESDHAFMSRLMEDVGISYYFEQVDDRTRLVLADAPHVNAVRPARIAFQDTPMVAEREHITKLRIGRRVRPGRYTMQDHDYRRAPGNQPRASAAATATDTEAKLERFHYTPGAFLYRAEKGDATPSADDRGMARSDEAEAARTARNRLDAKRGTAKTCVFETNAHDLAPATVIGMLDHPRSDLGPDKPWLIVKSTLTGRRDEKWHHSCEAHSAAIPYRSLVHTPKPKIAGVESATVVGPAGEEIHTDEFGRVRVHFHWDRESAMNEQSSCWLHVNQPWGGTGYGGTNLPRIGQEVLVDFLGGDPDRPVITGRVYTNLQKTPYALPTNKTQSGWRSNSSPTTGGYNEIMFEDKAGEELVRMQAEKDLHKLVKNDEEVQIGRDRTKEVGRDDTIQVGHDETRSVANDRQTSVGNNESKNVGGNKDSSIGKSLMEQIAQSARQMVGENKSTVVGQNRAAMIGQTDSVTTGQEFHYTVSPEGEQAPSEDSTGWHAQADRYWIVTKGGAAIVLQGNEMVLYADKITVQGAWKTNGKAAKIECPGNLTIKGEKILLNPE